MDKWLKRSDGSPLPARGPPAKKRKKGGAQGTASPARATLVSCPVCNKVIPDTTINSHLDSGCDGAAPSAQREAAAIAEVDEASETEAKALKLSANEDEPLGDGGASNRDSGVDGAAPSAQREAVASLEEKPIGGVAPGNAFAELQRAQAKVARRERMRNDLGDAVDDTPQLPGHLIIYDFITAREEEELVAALDACLEPCWTQSGRGVSFARGMSFGATRYVGFDHQRRVPMPEFVKFITDRMPSGCPSVLGQWEPDECNALDYYRDRGHYLNAHFDDRDANGAVLATLSLLGGAVMTYRRDAAAAASQKRVAACPAEVRVRLPRRSLVIQTGVCRYSYTHGIDNADLPEGRRASVTFRDGNARRGA